MFLDGFCYFTGVYYNHVKVFERFDQFLKALITTISATFDSKVTF